LAQFSRLARWKNPAYTGVNRCLPCTAVNVCIAVVGTIVLALGLQSVVPRPAGGWVLVASVAVFAGALGLIYVRGYLIPGTPELTKRYLPSRVARLFSKAVDRPASNRSATDATALLVETDVVVDDPAVDDVALDPVFAAEWRDRMAAYRFDDVAVREAIGRLAGIDPDGIELTDPGFATLAWYDDERIATWESPEACLADAAASSVFPAWDPAWDDRSVQFRTEVLGALRLFLDRCPTCDGTVALSHDVVSSCCSSRDVVAAGCRDCGARLCEIAVADPSAL
jgi:hypothetical protein